MAVPITLIYNLDEVLVTPGKVPIKEIENGLLLQERRPSDRQRYGLLPGDYLLSKRERDILFTKYHSVINRAPKATKTLQALLAAPLRVWWMVERLLKPMETCIAYGLPNHDREYTRFITKWWVKCVSITIKTGRTQPFVKYWKKFALKLRRHFFGFVGPETVFDGMPAFPRGSWMVKNPSELSREERALCASLMTTRSFPGGDGEAVNEAMDKHLDVYTTIQPSLSAKERKRIDRYATVALHEIMSCAKHEGKLKGHSGHISITNSAAFGASRTAGGRAKALKEHFYSWIQDFPDGREEPEVFGLPHPDYDYPRYVTMRNAPLYPGYEHLTSKVKDFGAPGADLEEEGYLNSTPIGMEGDVMSRQCLTYCLWFLIKEGYLTSVNDHRGKPPPVSRSSISEPGGKTRVVTQSLVELVTLGQPVQHALRELLMADPTLKTGLGAAAQSYELHKRMYNQYCWNQQFPEEAIDYCTGRQLLFSDFEEATDNIDFEVAHLLIDVLVREWRIQPWVECFLRKLASPVHFVEEDLVTTQGLLMGMPGTKFMLHYIDKVINVWTHDVRIPRSYAQLLGNPFGAAGDDIFDLVLEEEVPRFFEACKSLRMKVSAEKTGVYKWGSPYCELLLLNNDFSKPEGQGGSFCDSIRLRLVSAETKMMFGDEDTCPLYGKAYKFTRECAWTPEYYPGAKKRLRLLFFRNFRKYMQDDFHVFVHRNLGGLGLALDPVEDMELYKVLPSYYKQLLEIAHKRSSPKIMSVLHAWSSSNSTRGVKSLELSGIEALIAKLFTTESVDDALQYCADEHRIAMSMSGASLAYGGDDAMADMVLQMLCPDESIRRRHNVQLAEYLLEPPDPAKRPRYREKLDYLKRRGWRKVSDVARMLAMPDLWTPDTKPDRGYRTRSFAERSRVEQSTVIPDGTPEISEKDFDNIMWVLRKYEFWTVDVMVNTRSQKNLLVSKEDMETLGIKLPDGYFPPDGKRRASFFLDLSKRGGSSLYVEVAIRDLLFREEDPQNLDTRSEEP